ncbi:MAG: hypothetical protein WAZ60_12105, partial [Desulfosalsimonadaceae bacterium]
LALYNALPGSVSPILLIVRGRFVDFYPLKQFAPVIHGNRQARGRIAMGSPRRKCVAFLHELIAWVMDHWRVGKPVPTRK